MEPQMKRMFTAAIRREGDGFVAICPELDVASQGQTVEEARDNLREAVELFLETASPQEVKDRMHEEIYRTRSVIPSSR
jgi:predicted RNase H-like HicB family nuclease